MPARRFIGYFIVLSACSTIAFASSLIGQPPLPATQEADSSLAPLLSSLPHGHWHKSVPKRVQMAQAE